MKAAAASYIPPNPPAALAASPKLAEQVPPRENPENSDIPPMKHTLTEEHYLYSSPADGAQELLGLPSLPTSQDLFALASGSNTMLNSGESNRGSGSSSNASSSTEESDGPITPETYAIDNAELVEVPELSESDGVGIAGAIMPVPVVPSKKLKKPVVAGDDRRAIVDGLQKLSL